MLIKSRDGTERFQSLSALRKGASLKHLVENPSEDCVARNATAAE